MTEAMHTALPWHTERDSDWVTIRDAEGLYVTSFLRVDVADADGVVTAVNERPALLAVRDAAKALRDFREGYTHSFPAGSAHAAERLLALEAALDTALKQAGAE